MNRAGWSVFLLLLALVISSSSYAQTHITGKVLDGDSRCGLECANIVVLQGSRGRIISFCPADQNGCFSLLVANNGNYKVEVSFVGYKTLVQEIKCNGESIDLGDICLEKTNDQLSEAMVVSRQVIRRESDRIVYDASSDPDAARLFMSEFMRKIPGLKEGARRGRLEYKGDEIGQILIDGKHNTVINTGRQYAMSFIKANYLKTIELVLPGSPEYQNKTPILLLSLKKELPYGFASQIRGGAGSLGDLSASPDVVVNMPLMSIGFNYAYRFNDRPELVRKTERTVFDPDNGDVLDNLAFETVSRSSGASHVFSADASTSLKKIVLNGSLNTSLSKDYDTRKTFRGDEASVSDNERIMPFSLNGGLSAVYSWSKTNRITLKYTCSDRSYHETLNSYAGVTENEVDNRQHNVGITLMLRDQSRLSKWALRAESGVMVRKYGNVSNYWDNTVSGMDYQQVVSYLKGMYAGYVNGNKFSYSVSMDAEYVDNTGQYIDGGPSLDYNDVNIVPSAGFKARLGNNNYLSAVFAYHSQRPGANQLSMYSNASNPYDVSVGNANLKGTEVYEYSLTDVCERPEKLMKRAILSVSYLASPGAIENVRYVSSENKSTSTYINLLAKNDIVFHSLFEFSLPGNSTLSIGPELIRRSYDISEEYSNDYWLFRLSQDFVTSIKGFEIRENFNLRPFSNSALSTSFDMEPRMDVSISRYWSGPKVGASIDFNDILNGRGFKRTSSEYINYTQNTYSQQYGRSISASVYWRFGKFKNHSGVSHSSYDL